jgi:hypothetical protein
VREWVEEQVWGVPTSGEALWERRAADDEDSAAAATAAFTPQVRQCSALHLRTAACPVSACMPKLLPARGTKCGVKCDM